MDAVCFVAVVYYMGGIQLKQV